MKNEIVLKCPKIVIQFSYLFTSFRVFFRIFWQLFLNMNRVLTRILTQTSIRHVHTDIVNPDFFQRALQRFPKQCDLAFAYGSGVFQQDGNVSKSNMTDFIIVVNNSEEWHAENLELNPKDYSGVMSMLGPKIISEVQDKFGAKCYFNTLIPFEDGLIKYGVINR